MSLQTAFSNSWNQDFAAKTPVLLAVSGGSDSMVMCHLFHTAKIPFAIAHCNFQLRGADADADEKLVEQEANRYNVPFFVTRFDTQGKADELKKGIQETARILRYEWLEKVRSDNGYVAIATAHHANDNAETLLMNLFKGTGILGLHAIPKINGRIIRPLLFATKEEVKGYIREHNIEYRDDASNASDKYLRNAVRHNVIPEIEKLFPQLVTTLNRNVERFSEAEQIYYKAIESELKKLIDRRGNDVYISIRKLRLRKPLNTICYELFKEFGFQHTQIAQLISLMDSDSGSYVLSQTHRVLKDREHLIITSLSPDSSDLFLVQDYSQNVVIANGVFSFSEMEKPQVIPNDLSVALVDISAIEGSLKVRRWKKGDYFYPFGMKMKKKKLSDFFIDNKLSVHQKEQIWVIENDKKIVWVAGMRLDERFKLKKTTEKVLRILYKATRNTDS
ncbi:MAG: tRNA lysidine(34) synthetase TilS [Flavipsychrobacter sp.]